MAISISLDLTEEDNGRIYSKVINQVERELLSTIMEIANYNQSKAAQILGISRGGLRVKLNKHYGSRYNALSKSSFPDNV